jgi:hypothetical protein
VCFHDGQYICFNPIYHPPEKWLEVQSFTSTEKLVNCTQVNDPNEPVSICFYVCATIAKKHRALGQLWGLDWERTLSFPDLVRLNDKYICPKDNSGTSGCASYEQLYYAYWGCERWKTWLKGEGHTSHGTVLFYKKENNP